MTPVISTIHYAEWQYWWKDTAPFDSKTRWAVKDNIESDVLEVIKSFKDVYDDESFCCQGEGFRLMSENKTALMAAAEQISVKMRKYEKKHIKSLN